MSTDHALTRRHLLVLTGAGLCATALGASPEAAGAAPAKSGEAFDAGPLSDFGEGIADTFANGDPKVFVVREKDRLFVSSSECTHKKCVLKRTGAGYTCKCHKSKFTPEGVVLNGPAVKSLPRFGVTVDDRKHVMIDLSKRFEQDKWDDEAAFVKV